MPIKDALERRAYNLKRYEKLIGEAMISLGGVCVICGTTESLEFDHIDPDTKLFGVCSGWARSSEKFWTEVAKCQLLCRKHHEEKSVSEIDPFTHGTMYAWMKRNCDCSICAPAKREYLDEFNALRRAKRGL